MQTLIATDGSGCAAIAVEAFSASFDPARCGAVHVVTVLPAGTQLGDPDGRSSRVREQAAAVALEESASALRRAGFAVSTEVLSGHPAEAIVEATRRGDADLVVVGSRGLGGMGRLLLGSVSSKVARYSACPALVIRSPGPLRRVLVGTDGSPDGEAAVEAVAGLPFRALEVLMVATCYEASAPFLAGLAPTMVREVEEDHGAEVRAARASAEATAAATAGRLVERGLPAIGIAENGRPVEGLAVLATERSADLIAVGSRGRSAITAFVLGSTSAGLVALAPTNLLVVHAAATGRAG